MKEVEQSALEQEKQRAMQFLQEKVLGFYFHLALAIEKHDYLVPTLVYNKALKRDGNRTLQHMEEIMDSHFQVLYDDNPEFTTNMFAKIEKVIERIAMVEFGDYPILLELLEEFHHDKEMWRDNVVSKFNILDADLKTPKNGEANSSQTES